jgi:DNA-binding transcriptional LysR family regulator
MCDIAVLRTALDDRRYDAAVVGHERRYCAPAADDPWAGRRSIRLADVAQWTVVVDSRTGTTTAELWPSGGRPELRDAPPVDVRVAWRRPDPHPATPAAVALLTELYRH